jgi:beta-xylosidase
MSKRSSHALTLNCSLRIFPSLAIGALLLRLCMGVCSAADDYLFTSFRGNGEDGLHLALSADGYHWTALKHDTSFLRPEVGGKLMRDPCLAQGPDGLFHLVWTTGWTVESGKVFGYASSKDLVHWSKQRGIEVMQNEPRTRNIWAPEIFYDAANPQWLVFWCSTIPGKYVATDGTGDDGYNHRIYYGTTKDFVQFSDSKLLYDPGFNCIDATLLPVNGRFYLFFKDERKAPLRKNLRYAVAAKADGPFGPPSEPFTGDWVEGPSAIKIGQEWLVYFDHYAAPHYYGAVRSRDLKAWEDCSKEMQFPPGHRHGTILRIPESLTAGLLGP